MGIRHINLLAVDGGEVMSHCLGNATELMSHCRIDIVAASWPAQRNSDGLPTDILRKYGYDFYASGADGFAPAEPGVPREHFQFAINERLRTLATGGPQPQHMLDLGALCRRHDIRPRGVVHVGAHEGLEWPSYQKMGISAAIFIEANPEVFSRLVANLGAVEGVALANCAIAEVSGRARLHITSGDQCSSLLPLGRHLEYYPEIVETRTIDVTAWTLDDLIAQLGMRPERFNLLNIDIQGAELQALKGAQRLLASIEAINVEINFEELYDGCAQIEDIDHLLSEHGFRRVATSCPFHPSWGDGFYLRSS
jgi:FkbM family methyltransferase